MDNNEELEFDLEDILKEFREEPPEEAEEPAQDALPNLKFEAPEPKPVLEPTLDIDMVPEPEPADAAEPVPTPEPAEPAPEETPEFAVSDLEQTQTFQPAGESAAVEPNTDATNALPTPPPAGVPAFEVEEEFIPAPIVFTPRSRLKELKKQLVAGPERRYYELSEVGIGRMQAALLLNLLVVVLCAGVTAMFVLDMVPENRLKLVIFSQILAMLVSALLGCGLMLDSLGDLLRGRFTVNTLLTLTFIACMVDGSFCLKELRVPCCAAFSLEMTMAMWARLQRHHTEMAQMDTMRKAVRLHGLVRVEKYYEGKDGLLRKEAQVSDFMDNYRKMPAPEVMQSVYALLGLLLSIGIAVFSAMLHGTSMGVQILSTSLLVAVPASFFVAISRPTAILEARLHMVGTVLCGWKGVKELSGKAVFPLTDQDLFPQGSTKLNGVKFYSERNPDAVVSYTVSLIRAAGGGLVPVFDQLLSSRNGSIYPVSDFRHYGDGGIGGVVDNEPVLVGTLDFLQDMGIVIPEGTMVSQAVYTAVDGELCAVYAISYAKMRSAAAGLVTLCCSRKVIPLKLSGDFMLTESFLRSKFNVKTRRMKFPEREVCQQLQRYAVDPDEPVLAITTREELVSAAYAISGARALRQATKMGVVIHLIGGILGLLIMAVLGYLGNTDLLTPVNILLYQLVWAVPGLLVTEWTRFV